MKEKYLNTKTGKNLETAFAGESMARNKYTYFASKARKDGFEQIAALFEETAQNEKEATVKKAEVTSKPSQQKQEVVEEKNHKN